MINDLPTIFEVVTGNAKQAKDQSVNHNSSKSKSSGGKVEASVFSIFALCISLMGSYLCLLLCDLSCSLVNLNLTLRLQRCLHHQEKKMTAEMMRKMTNKVRFVARVETTMVEMSSGYVAMLARNGSMENA